MTLQRITNGRGHWYKLDGRKADGVTTLIGDGLRKKAVEAWGIRTVAEYVADNLEQVYAMRSMGREAVVAALKQSPYSYRDRAAKRGTEVHRLADRLMHGEEFVPPEELAGHVESYVRFLDEWRPAPVLTEACVGSRRWNYCGTLDIVADLPDGRRVIADIKTGRSGIFADTVLQLAAYRYAEFYLDSDGSERSMADLGITGALGIWVRADGYDVYDLPADEAQHKKFLHIAVGARWLRESQELIGAAVRPSWEGAA